jgi:signal transduction histidine kinase
VQVLSVATAEESFNGLTHVEVLISDNGEGMPEEMHDKIFELFFTTKIAMLGIGLGLPISKESMEDHGGSISVSSIVGKGFDLFSLFPI